MWKLHLKLLIAFSPINFFQSRDRVLAQLKNTGKENKPKLKGAGYYECCKFLPAFECSAHPVVSIGRFTTFYVVFIPLEYIPSTT